MPKRTSAANDTAINVVLVTLDGHVASAMARAMPRLARDLPGLTLTQHCAGEWAADPDALTSCKADIAAADIVIANMLFMDEHIKAVLPALKARRDACDAMVCFMCDSDVMKLTRIGAFKMGGKQSAPMAMLKKLRGSKHGKSNAGAKQVAMLRRLPRILRYIPGTAQDVRAFFLVMQYWLAGSEENVANLVRFLINRYAAGSREALKGSMKVPLPVEYPETGVYHPRMKGRVSDRITALPAKRDAAGTVGLLLLRSYVLAGNARHYDCVIEQLESRGLRVVPAFASGLDSRPAIEQFFMRDGKPVVDAVVSLTSFSLVGGPAYNDARAAEAMLASLDVPYLAAHATEFQSLERWQSSERGLLPVEATMMVAIPELDGAIAPTLFAGRSDAVPAEQARDMQPHEERIETLASRVENLVRLRATERASRKVAIVLFNFPPNSGATGTAAFLSVYASLFNTLVTMREEGYTVDVPDSVDALRERILAGNAKALGADANVLAKIPVDDHVARETWLSEIEEQWGPAPGKLQTDGRSLFVLGERFGNVVVAVQPGFGYEGDPMRLLFEKGFAPTHAFSAFYRYLREDFAADVLLHFGTHGALEFMPGKQTGMSSGCWPERLIGTVPNLYLYAANNPSEGTIAKRRTAATLISYLTPPVTRADLYRGLADLQASVDRWRSTEPGDRVTDGLAELIQAQAAELDLAAPQPAWGDDDAAESHIVRLQAELQALRETLIPHGMHVLGEAPNEAERTDLLNAMSSTIGSGEPIANDTLARIVAGDAVEEDDRTVTLRRTNELLKQNVELQSIIHALDGGFVRPVQGGDLLRTPDILPTGRNLHGFDPFRIPSVFAVADGRRQAALLVDKYQEDSGALPESIAFVLWGTDNLKSEGGPIGQVLALLGARPRVDGYGRLCGAELIPLEELGRPRIDVVMTLSGIFRDLLPNQTQMLAEAAYLAAEADEPIEMNFVRKHALAYQAECGCDLETAALRVFSNADGAYGSNVNQMIDNSRWNDEDELAEAYTRRKCFAFGRSGQPQRQPELLRHSLADVDMAYQNLESTELGVTTIDHYFDTLGGITKAARRASGRDVEVYIGDQTNGREAVRTLGDQVALETRTRMLNPKWFEAMLKHGYEGVRTIESHVTNTMGWSATTGKVAPWVYQQLTQTYVLDKEMRARLSELNPMASVRVANRLLEAHERQYWSPDEATLEELRRAGDELEDRLEGVGEVVAA